MPSGTLGEEEGEPGLISSIRSPRFLLLIPLACFEKYTRVTRITCDIRREERRGRPNIEGKNRS